MGAVVEHGDPEQRGEREDRGHLRPPAGHPNSERPGPALPPRDPHRRRTGRNRRLPGRARLGIGASATGWPRLASLFPPGTVAVDPPPPRRRGLQLRLRAGKQAAAGRQLLLARCLFMRRGTLFQEGGAEDKQRGGVGGRHPVGCGVGPGGSGMRGGKKGVVGGGGGSAILAGCRGHWRSPKWGPDKSILYGGGSIMAPSAR